MNNSEYKEGELNKIGAVYENQENIIEKGISSISDSLMFSPNAMQGVLSSIEMTKSAIKQQLEVIINFKDDFEKELDFLLHNDDVMEMLPIIVSKIRYRFGDDTGLFLELLDEEDDWKTLFIDIHVKASLNEINSFSDEFYNWFLTQPKSITQKLNLEFTPYAI